MAAALTVSGSASAEVQTGSSGQVTSNTYDAAAGSAAAPSDSGAPIDPLAYDCTTPAGGPSGCDNVGLTHGYYANHVVNFLYTANFFCDTSVASKATTGCEAGTTYSKLPPAATSEDPLYIPIPLGFTPTQGLQCPTTGDCIDHPPTMDMSALYPVLKPLLGLTSASQLDNAPLSPHSHIIFTRNDNLPEWWNVVGVPVTSQAGFNTVIAATSETQLTNDLGSPGVYTSFVPTNAFLYFQTLAGTSATTADAAMSQGTYNGATGPAATGTTASVDPLAIPASSAETSDCGAPAGATAPPPCAANDIGLTAGFYAGSTVNLLYSQNYFCDRSVASQSPNGCEAGAPAANLPPGTASTSQTNPLYIITPLFSPTPTGLQCPTTGYCIDHPPTVDLSRLASTLDPLFGTTPSQLADAPLSPHSHIVLTTNNNQPEWWNVNVIGVTSQAAYSQIVSSPNEYATAQSLAASNAGVTMPIPTNIFLWFQVLPGTVASSSSSGASTGATSGPSGSSAMSGSTDPDDTSPTSDNVTTMPNALGDPDDTSAMSDSPSTTMSTTSSTQSTTASSSGNQSTSMSTTTSTSPGDPDDSSSTSDMMNATSSNGSTGAPMCGHADMGQVLLAG